MIAQLPPLTGGMNTTNDQLEVRHTQAHMMKNLDIKGLDLSKRKGTAKWGEEISSTGRCTGGLSFETSDGTISQVIVCHGEKIYYTTGSSVAWTELATGLTDSTQFRSAIYLDEVFMTNGVDDVYLQWDGSSLTTNTWSGDMGLGAGVLPFDLAVGAERMLAITKTRLYWTGVGDATDFAGGDVAAAAAFGGADGDTLTKIHYIKGKFFVFKNRSTWVIAFDENGASYIDNVSKQIGCTSVNGVTEKDGYLHVLSENGIRVLEPLSATYLQGEYFKGDWSKDIREGVIDEISSLSRCAAYYYAKGGRYMLSLNQSSSGNDIVACQYLLEDETPWTVYTGIKPAFFFEHDGELLYGSDVSGQVYVMEQTDRNDDGEAILLEIDMLKRGGEADQRVVDGVKQYDALIVEATINVQSTLNIEFSSSLDTEIESGSLYFNQSFEGTPSALLGQGVKGQEPLGGGGLESFSAEQRMRERTGVGKTGYFIRIKLTNNTIDEYMSIRRIFLDIQNLPQEYSDN